MRGLIHVNPEWAMETFGSNSNRVQMVVSWLMRLGVGKTDVKRLFNNRYDRLIESLYTRAGHMAQKTADGPVLPAYERYCDLLWAGMTKEAAFVESGLAKALDPSFFSVVSLPEENDD